LFRLPSVFIRLAGRLTGRLTLQLEFWVLVTSLPSLLLGGWLLTEVYQELTATRRLSAETFARQALDVLDRLVFERYADAQVFSGLSSVRDPDRSRLAGLADHLVTAYAPYYRLALVIDRAGRILAVNRVDGAGNPIPTARLLGRSVADEPWVKQTLAAAEPVLVEDFHADPLVEEVYHDHRPVMSFSAPIRNPAGEVTGIWSSRLSLAPLEEVLTILSGMTGPGSQFPLILRRAQLGSVLLEVGPVSPPDRLRAEAQSGSALPLLAAVTSTGFSRSPGLGWRLEVYQPPGVLDRPTMLAWLSIWFGLLVLGGAVSLGVIVHRRVILPIVALTELARDQATLARTVPVERTVVPTARCWSEATTGLLSRADELGELIRTSSAMAREVQGQVARLTTLNAIAQSFQREMVSLSSLLTRIVHTARELTGARYAALGVFDEPGGDLVQLITAGMDDATKEAIGALPTGRGLLGHLAKEEGVLRLKDLTQHPAFGGFPPHHPAMTSFMGVSIRAHGRLFGRLYLTDKEGPSHVVTGFTDLDEQVIAALAYQAGAAIENAGLFHQTKTAKARYRAILDSVEEGIYGIDLSGRCLFLNRAGAARLGYEVGHLVDRHIHPLIHHKRADGWPCVEEDCPIQSVFRTAQAVRLEHEVLWRHDGTFIPVVCVSTPMYGEGDTVMGAVVSFTDMTDRRRLEEQLRQAQKMEAIGRLAGGIAHDFNNLFTAILGYSNILLKKLDPDRQREVLAIKKAGERAASLTQQLLAFSRKQVLDPRVLDLNIVVTEMQQIVCRLIGERIDLLTVPAPALGRVKVDPDQIKQVILNLALNARDAMPDGGRLTIETANAALDEAYCRTHPEVSPGPYVMLAVSDTGSGMDAATLARCLEPFFTTKPSGKGAGLGLSTVYGIAKQSGGTVGVYSEPGHGTTVKVYLPRVEEALSRPAPPVIKPVSRPCTETLLLVENDEGVRNFACAVLTEEGYTVLEASNGEEAIRLSARHDKPIHLLVTDVVLPGINGRVLAERLMSQRPNLRVLYLSGYAENAIVHKGVLDPGTPFLHKPFTADGLAGKVRDLLDAPEL
jgi:PAS domain S-box-containing protein